jgi:hypothetical protein
MDVHEGRSGQISHEDMPAKMCEVYFFYENLH